jgi:6-phosphogluconate dehydrogenase
MVHNGIEYADMQLIGESYDLLRSATGASAPELAGLFRDWNNGELGSYLIEITADILSHRDERTGKPFVDVVLDRAQQKGTGRWTALAALELTVPVGVISEAVTARMLSGAGLRSRAVALVGPAPQPIHDAARFVENVRAALMASKVVAYAQGLDLIRAASEEYDWGVDLAATASVWRGGCIIRAKVLDQVQAAFVRDPALPSLLLDPGIREILERGQLGWRRSVGWGAMNGVPVPCLSSGLAYYDALRARRLPAALVQAQRDYFGAHTYRRRDMVGEFHTDWAGDRLERQV